MTPEPEWVDLGLPSGLLWHSVNLGATRPESAGLYFSWGNVEGHPNGSGYNFSDDNYRQTPGYSISADLTLSQDAANHLLGGSCRMPTLAEANELISNCSFVWTSVNGVNGMMLTSNRNGAKLFLPASGAFYAPNRGDYNVSGYLWTSSYYSATDADKLNFSSGGITTSGSMQRRFGFAIRAVKPGASQSDLHAQTNVVSPTMVDHGTDQVLADSSKDTGQHVYTKKKKGGK